MGLLILLLLAQDVDAGPIRIESQAPLQSLRSGMLPRTPLGLREGEREFRFSTIWVNHWALDEPHYRLDYEQVDARASVAWGIDDAWGLEVGVMQVSLFGGVMDNLIQEFHDLFSIPQNGRDEFPRRDLEVDLRSEEGPRLRFDEDDRGAFVRTLSVSVDRRLARRVFASLTLSWPFTRPDGMNDSAAVNAIVSVSATRRIGPVHLTAAVSSGRFGKERLDGFALRRFQTSALLAAEWPVSPDLAIVARYLHSQSVIAALRPFSQPSHEFSFGVKLALASDRVLEIAVLENILLPDNSPDLGIHVGMAVGF